MEKIFEVSCAKAGIAEKSYGNIKVAMQPDGSWVTIPMAIARGVEDGPTLWVQAGTHGEEVGGSFSVTQLFHTIDPSQLRGNVIAVPVVNTPAWMAKNKLTPTDSKNMNRVYPGRLGGSLSEQIAYHLLKAIRLHADVVIDIHDGGWMMDEVPSVIIHVSDDCDLNKRQFEMARVTGLKYLWLETEALPGSSGDQVDLCTKLAELGIPTLTFEFGGSYNYPKNYERTVGPRVEAVLNLMKHLRMIDGQINKNQEQILVGHPLFHPVRHGGFAHNLVVPGDIVTKDQVIAEIKDIFNRIVIEKARCPINKAVIIATRAYPTIDAGECVAIIGPVMQEEELPF